MRRTGNLADAIVSKTIHVNKSMSWPVSVVLLVVIDQITCKSRCLVILQQYSLITKSVLFCFFIVIKTLEGCFYRNDVHR